MTTHHHRALTFTALLLAGMTLGAPVASAASHPHTPVASRLVLPKAQFHDMYQVVASHSLEMPSQIGNSFEDLHQE
jgi:hypothetical protein